MKVLVTGAAGFIGYYVSKMLLERGDEVVGFDCINDYYEVSLKYGRLNELGISREDTDSGLAESSVYPSFRFVKGDLQDYSLLERLFQEETFDAVCNLAAQAGVRYSLENPRAYTASNIVGFLNILEACRNYPVKHLVYASSSSVFGLNEKVPFTVKDNVDHPVSLYAATKKSNELMAHSYSHLYGIPTSGLRFFTVYGPWGRPDMAPILFSRAIMSGEKIKVFNHGKMERDFTYVEDIARGVLAVIDHPAEGNPGWSGLNPDPSTAKAPYRVFNIGNGTPVKLMDFIGTLEKSLGKKADAVMMPMQPGDVVRTWADTDSLEKTVGYKPETSLKEGIDKFVSWFVSYEESNK
jgi:UDP-glucuronate 4-epimerase